jgi:hypothetical protein
LIDDSNGQWDINSFVLSFFEFTLEAVILLKYTLLGHSAGDCWLGWFRDGPLGPDGALLLLLLLLRVQYVGKA